MKTEIWKPIKGYEGCYEISNFGRCRSVDRIDRRGALRKGKLLKSGTDTSGYAFFGLSVNNVLKAPKAHVLVAKHFLGPRPEGYKIDHVDGDQKNNSADNLEYVTHRENIGRGRLCDRNETKSSQYRGVYYYKKIKKYGSKIQNNRTIYNLGYYDTEEQAHGAYLSKLAEFKE